VPAKIASVSQKDIAFHNPQTAADLLGLSGKVFIQKSQQGGGSPMIRGFATNRLIYTVDGVRMNTAIFRSGNIQNVINLDPFTTEKTEVVFGPGSVMFGSDAIGGTMGFFTLQPDFSTGDKPLIKGSATLRYSSANQEKTGHIHLQAGWKKWAFLTGISGWDFDHLRQGSHGPDDYIKPVHVQRINGRDSIITQKNPLLQIPTAYSQLNVLQKIRFAPNKSLDFTYAFHASATSPFGRYDRHNRFRNGRPRYAEWDYGPQTWKMHLLSVHHEGRNQIYDRLSVRIALQAFGESRVERILNSDTKNTQAENVLAWSANVDFQKQTHQKNQLFYGLEFVRNDVDSDGKLTKLSTAESEKGASRYPTAAWSSFSVYLQDAFQFSDKWSVQAGGRYNRVDMRADFSNNLAFYPLPFTETTVIHDAFTGSAGTVFRFSENFIIRANLGTAFRSPNVDDLGKFFDSEPGTVTVPNPDLKPEYARNADIGWTGIFSRHVKIDISAFYTVLNNALVRRNFLFNGNDSILYNGELSRVQAIQNVAKAKVYGLEGGIEVKLPAGLRWSADLTYQVGEEELEDGSVSPSRHAAPFFGISRLRYNKGKFEAEINVNYQGERKFSQLAEEERGKTEIYAKDTNGNNYAPAWYTIQMKAAYHPGEHFSVHAGIENITDQRYRPYSSGVSGAGRNFMISATVRW
jgi:hemoglobin/transferrin/lactoferrin receptor protein